MKERKEKLISVRIEKLFFYVVFHQDHIMISN